MTTRPLALYNRFMGKLWMILSLFFCTYTSASLYDIKDLEVLEANKSYKEFLDHALDVRPAERKKQWREMVNNMSVGFIKEQLRTKAFNKINFDYIENLNRWPTLQKDSYFQHKRKEFALHYLDDCLGKSCKSDLMGFWYSTQRQDGELAKKLSIILRQKDPKSNITPFLSVIGHDDYALYHCKKPWIQSEIFSLVTEPLRMEEEDKLKKVLNNLVGKECWKSLRPIVHQALIRGPGLKQDYAFALLKSRGDLSQEWMDFYYTSYFLGSPVPGNKLNASWNTIKELGQNFNRRVKVLNKLKKLDPLPGKLFSLIDNGKKNTLIKYFKKNFPEYIDHYSKTCLNYLQGTVSFANGNPTPDCDNLFAGNHVEDRIRIKHSAIKK